MKYMHSLKKYQRGLLNHTTKHLLHQNIYFVLIELYTKWWRKESKEVGIVVGEN